MDGLPSSSAAARLPHPFPAPPSPPRPAFLLPSSTYFLTGIVADVHAHDAIIDALSLYEDGAFLFGDANCPGIMRFVRNHNTVTNKIFNVITTAKVYNVILFLVVRFSKNTIYSVSLSPV
ncbi:hypothetical protein [Desulfolutivibrio sp.]|uniref:hypothetical protein n=1 Tax=Desulfolutivibrio sp. TaxID=2773296 RepID=UPI002F961D87